MRVLVQASDAKGCGHGPASWAEHGADQQHQHAPPGRRGEHATERRHPSDQLHLRRFEQPAIRHLDPEPKFGTDSPPQIQP